MKTKLAEFVKGAGVNLDKAKLNDLSGALGDLNIPEKFAKGLKSVIVGKLNTMEHGDASIDFMKSVIEEQLDDDLID